MIKEPIMIDGVNVRKCPFYEYQTEKELEMRYPNSGDCEIGLAGYLFDFSPIQEQLEKHCLDNPNCHYKQLKRKEQECEELKEKYLELKEQNGGNIVQLNTVNEQLDQLKAENVELKELVKTRIEDLCDSCGASSMFPMPCKVYEQALQDIKEFVENEMEQDVNTRIILQKISEVIDD